MDDKFLNYAKKEKKPRTYYQTLGIFWGGTAAYGAWLMALTVPAIFAAPLLPLALGALAI